jgi:L-methionine (R)-S-oxide reductase
MAEAFVIPQSEIKEEKYKEILPQIEGLVENESDLIANLANIAAALKFGMSFFWVGFYMVKQGELVLGPFQGPVACTRIPFSKGVCGAGYTRKETIIVPDVEQFPGHIACSSLSKSEIVIPIIKEGEVNLILDVDSEKLNDFDFVDQKYLEQITSLLYKS